MFTKFVSKKIQETLNAKERVLSRKNNGTFVNNPSADSYKKLRDISSRTPFVRMISNKKRVNNIVISGGLRDKDGNMRHGFEKVYNQTENSGIRPIAGIKDVEISYKGGFKAIRETTVNWTIGSLEELENLTPYFLTAGKTVMVDWGWVNSDKSIEQQFGSTYFKDGKVDSRLFTDPQTKILSIGGNYGAIGGVISNFEYQLRQDGGFDCTTKLISIGSNLFKKPVDKGNSEKTLVGSRQESNQSRIGLAPMDSLMRTLVNLKEYVIDTYFVDLNSQAAGLIDATYGKTLGGSNDLDKKLVSIARENKNDEKYRFIWNESGDKKSGGATVEGTGVGGGIVVDRTENVIWYCPVNSYLSKTAETVYVTWGWLEDNLFSRYTAYVSDDDSLKLTLRSVDTVVNEAGEPELNDGDNLTYVKKELVKIGNHPFLHGKNPTAFLLSGQNPSIDKFAIDEGSANASGFLRSEYDEKRMGNNYLKGIFKTLIEYIPGSEYDDNSEKIFEVAGTNRSEGYLRNVLVNIVEVQKAFGINVGDGLKMEAKKGFWDKKWNSRSVSMGDLNPPATIEAGIQNLLNQLNDNFFNIWDFKMTSDSFDSTNIKIIDNKQGVNSNPIYTDFNQNSGILKKEGIYKFPSFKMGSTVKSQNLAFKIPNAMALTAMYGSNKNIKSISDDSQHDNSDLASVFGKDNGPEYDDNYLNGLEPIHKKVNWGVKDMGEGVYIPSGNRVGPTKVDPNNRIVSQGNGLRINPNASWNPVTIEDREPSPKFPNTSTKAGGSQAPWYDYNSTVGDYGDIINVKHWNWETETSGDAVFVDEIFSRFDYDSNKEVTKIPEYEKKPNPAYYYNTKHIGGNFAISGDVLPIIKSVITNNIRNIKDRENIYKGDFIIPAELSLEIDGIEGLLPGDIIHTDYIQHKYNKSVVLEQTDYGPFTYFQIFGINHKLDSGGWTTELTTKMRVNGEVLNKNAQEVINQLTTAKVNDEETPSGNQEVLNNAAEQEVENAISDADELQQEIDDELIRNMANQFSVTTTQDAYSYLDSSDVEDDEMLGIVEENQGIGLWYTSAAGTQTLDETGARGTNNIYNTLPLSDSITRELTNTTLETVDSDNTNTSLDAMGFVSLPPSLTGQNADTGNLTVSEGQGPDGQEIKQDSNGTMYYAEGTEEATTAVRDWIRGVNMKVDKSGDVKQIETHHDSKKEAVLKNNLLEISGNSEIAQVAIGDPGTTPDPGDEAFIGPMMAPVTVEEVVGGLMSPEEVEKKQDAVADGENLQILADEVARKEELARLAAEVAELDRRKEQAKADNELYKEIIKIGEWVSTGKSDLEGAANMRADGNKLPALFQKLGREQIPLSLGIGLINIELRGTEIFEYGEDDPEPRYLYEKTWGVVDDRETKLFIMYPELRD